MLNPPGPTRKPSTISTIPAMIEPWISITSPTTTSRTAAIHKRNVMTFTYPLLPDSDLGARLGPRWGTEGSWM